MIKLENVSLVFQGGRVALSNVSTVISEGEFVYLIGHSGRGKSSLLKLLYKEYSPTKGEIEVVDMDVTSLPKWKIPLLRRKLGIVTQEPQLLEDRTTFENISFALEVLGFEDQEGYEDYVANNFSHDPDEPRKDIFPIDQTRTAKELWGIYDYLSEYIWDCDGFDCGIHSCSIKA